VFCLPPPKNCGAIRQRTSKRLHAPEHDATLARTWANELAPRKGKPELSDRVAALIRRPDSAPTKPRSDGREDRFHHVHVIGNA
jgi:hypothetical protein